MRRVFVLLHRYVGLALAAFLVVTGITGAIISWDHELDEWLNPHLFESKAQGEFKPALELVRIVEAADPRVQVSFFPIQQEQGHNASLFVEPKVDPKTGQLIDVDYNQ